MTGREPGSRRPGTSRQRRRQRGVRDRDLEPTTGDAGGDVGPGAVVAPMTTTAISGEPAAAWAASELSQAGTEPEMGRPGRRTRPAR